MMSGLQVPVFEEDIQEMFRVADKDGPELALKIFNQ